MTLEGTKSKQQFVGIGGLDYDLSADFIFWDTTDLKVYRRSADYPAIADDLLTETADYTVAGGEGENGTITTVATYSDGFLLVIRELPRIQPYDMVQGDGFATDSVETQLDKLTAMAQEDDTNDLQVLRLVPEDFSDANMELAAVNDKADRAGLFLKFSDTGDIEATGVVSDIGSYIVTWLNTALAIVQRDLNGDFAARIITALSFIGNLTGNVVGNLTGNSAGIHTGPVTGDVTGKINTNPAVDATTTQSGFAERATDVEALAETDEIRFIDSKQLGARVRFGSNEAFDGSSPDAFTDLDLSSIVGAKSRMVYLKITNGATQTNFFTRTKGESADVAFNSSTSLGAGASAGSISASNILYVLAKTDTAGVIEWMSSLASVGTTVDVESYW